MLIPGGQQRPCIADALTPRTWVFLLFLYAFFIAGYQEIKADLKEGDNIHPLMVVPRHYIFKSGEFMASHLSPYKYLVTDVIKNIRDEVELAMHDAVASISLEKERLLNAMVVAADESWVLLRKQVLTWEISCHFSQLKGMMDRLNATSIFPWVNYNQTLSLLTALHQAVIDPEIPIHKRIIAHVDINGIALDHKVDRIFFRSPSDIKKDWEDVSKSSLGLIRHLTSPNHESAELNSYEQEFARQFKLHMEADQLEMVVQLFIRKAVRLLADA